MATSETHIAGLDVTWNGRYMRQRCAWCGAVLLDYDLAQLQSTDGSGPTPWPAGVLIRRAGAGSYIVEVETSETDPAKPTPDDCCTHLDPTVTT